MGKKKVKFPHKGAFDAAQEMSRGFPKQFRKPFMPLVFVHAYPDLDEVLKGNHLIQVAQANYEKDVMMMFSNGMSEGEHVFLGLPRLKGVAKGYVEKIVDGIAYIAGMGSEIEK